MNSLKFCTIQNPSAAYDEMIELRMNVLLHPIGIPRSYINPEKEASDLLLGVYQNDRLVGCCIMTPIDTDTIQLRQMAVDPSVQKRGVGRMMLFFAEAMAKDKGYKMILMHARDAVLPFYQKCGYTVTSDQFFEVNIPHHKMLKTLEAESSQPE